MFRGILLLAVVAAQDSELTVPDWVIVGSAALGALALFILLIVSSRALAATRALAEEVKTAALEMRRFSEISQRQTELNNAPLLKVVKVEETPPDKDDRRGMRIKIKNVGFGSAVNVKCVLTDHNDSDSPFVRTELIGNETAAIEPRLLYSTIKAIRLEYFSQGGSYGHTTRYEMKTGNQSYAILRVR